MTGGRKTARAWWRSARVALLATCALVVGGLSAVALAGPKHNGSTNSVVTVMHVPDFSITASPGSLSLEAGGSSKTVTIKIKRNAYSTGSIKFSVSGLPAGVSGKLSPGSTSGNKVTLKLTAGAVTGAVKKSPVKITGKPGSSAGSASRSVNVKMTVTTSTLRAQGLQVTQGIQADNGRLIPSGLNQSGENYTNLALVAGKLTVVRFFADAHPAPKGVADVHAVLHAFSGGTELPGSPIDASSGPTKNLTDTGESGNAQVNDTELQSQGPANIYTFTLPNAWTFGTIKLVADLVAPPILPSLSRHIVNYIQQCGKEVCPGNSFTLKNITFEPTTSLAVFSIIAQPGSSTFTLPSSAGKVFKQARAVMPLSFSNLVIQPYVAETADIGGLNQHDALDAVQTIANNDNATNAVGVAAVASINGLTFNIPGGPFGSGGVNDTGLNGTPTQGGPSIVSAPPTGQNRPLTEVAHELSHQFGLLHASNECGGGQDSDGDDGSGQTGEPWSPPAPEPPGKPSGEAGGAPDDGIGQLNGIGLDTTKSPYVVIPNKGTFDYMSYCAVIGGGDPGDWISPKNYQALLDGDFLALPAARDLGPGRAAAVSAPPISGMQPVSTLDPTHLRVRAIVDRTGVTITSVGPRIGPPLPTGTSAFTLVARDAGGQVVVTAPMRAVDGHIDQSEPFVELDAEIPSAGVDSVQITNPAVVASRTRPAKPPTVQVLAPAAGQVLGGGGHVRVHWSSASPVGAPLTAQIDYSADGGVSWRTIYVGPNDTGNGIPLPASFFLASHAARVRVRVNDGFNETAAVSAPFTARDTPPVVTILSPAGSVATSIAAPTQGGVTHVAGDSRVELEGQAFDQGINQLTGTSLRWFDGRVFLGTGTTLSAGPLHPGVNHIILVAHDTAGLRAADTVTVVVKPVELPFLRLVIPRVIGRSARLIAVKALSKVPIIFRLGSERFALRAGVARRLRIAVRPGTRPLIVPMAAGWDQARIPFAALVRRS